MVSPHPRLIEARVHDDGINAWSMARIAPAPQVAGLIHSYSDYRERTGGFTTRRELPHTQGVLIVNLAEPLTIVGGDGGEIVLRAGEAFVAGVHLRPALSRSIGAQAGIHIHLPLASLRRLTGVPMDRLIDRVLPLDDLLGAGGRDLCLALAEAPDMAARVALIDRTLIRRFTAAAAIGSAQAHALALLRDRPDQDIADIARDIGWSRKHLADRVRDVVGVGPRSWRRLIRFERLTAAIDAGADRDWAGLACDAGYFDQSHMIREFREFAEMTPGEFVARSLADGGGLIEG